MLTLLGRAVTRTASALALIALTVGLPAGLLHYVGDPLPSRLPDPGDIIDVVTNPMSDDLLIQGMAALVWLLWLMLLGSVAVEAVAAIRGVTAPRPRLLRPTQTLAATLVAGLTAGIFAPAMVAPLSPAVSASAVAPTTTLLTTPTTTPLVELTVAASARPQSIPAQAAGTVTLVIRDCGYQYTVVKRDNLSRIAATCLGNPDRWPEIFELNKGRYWEVISGTTKLTDPNLIFPGWVLHLPDDAVAPPDARPVDPPPAGTDPAPATPTPSTTTPAPPPPPVSITPSVTPPTAGAGAATAVPSPTTVTASPAPQEPTPDRTAPADPRHDPAEGSSFVAVVGGFITAGLAAGLLFAAAMVWRRRRHRYRPTLIDNASLDDADLTPPLSGLTHLRQALRRQRPDLLQEPKPGPTVRDYTTANTDTLPTPPVGPTGAELAGLADLPVSAGLGLDGPGALDAARGLLVACLTAGGPDDPDAQGHLVVPASTLATLLGVSVIDLPRMRRLTVTATAGDAITHIEEEIIRRTRIMADHDVDTIPELRAAHPLAEPVPQLLLIADIPEQRHQRLANAIHLGEKVDIGAALIGAWPLGTTLTIAADGTATGDPDIDQVAVLDTDAATTTLTMLAEAHADTPTTPAAEQPDPPAPPADPPTEPAAPTPAPPTEPTPPPSASATDQRVQVRVLGEPAILGPDGVPMKGLRAKAVELLVYLAVHRDGATLSAIMEALWPDATMRRAGERLSTCVGNLRTTLRTVHPGDTNDAVSDDNTRDNGAAGRKAPDPIPNTGSHYHLDPAFVHVDLWTVLDQYTQVATADTDDQRRRHLDTAIAAISGPLAAGRDYDWIDTDREHVRRRLIKLYTHAAHLHTDEPQQVRHLYETACDLDPLNDDLARRAMHASAALDDANAIRTRLTALRHAVEDNGLDMDEGTEQLAQDLLRTLAAPPRRDDQ
ncbi:BTAD domain-containing putative transcriptional regulator [Micromonospora sp. WMMD1082]|uniref:BTAD domain-containing putative transcriptional regulator n=1 Tax=Micromonospora sp. WMMD1082 TaxID=3016104 RepID=UPI0024164135|nr:BTAD domain-containing putative transcriptional regulator [Micromonospora sp. WMMD1082]MDG4795431.1 BTAD domain-containing putative transcriptional regulator [Micromonospora sp. WMMD1082]